MKNIISPAKQKNLEEGENISDEKKVHQKKKKEKRAVGTDITNKASPAEGKRKESWAGKIGKGIF